jgi:hypothetical protein
MWRAASFLGKREVVEHQEVAVMRGVVGEVADELSHEGPTVVSLTPADVAEVGEELAASHARFAPLFARREQRAWAAV